MAQIKLIVSDIDGTLVHAGDKGIPPVLFDQIDRMAKIGVRFAPASGRQFGNLEHLFAPARGKIYYICENGAMVRSRRGVILGLHAMNWEKAIELAEDIMALPGCNVLMTGSDGAYICPKSRDFISRPRRGPGGYHMTVLDKPSDMPVEVLKVSLHCLHDIVKIGAPLVQKWQDEFNCALSGDIWLDFNKSDKGEGLKVLCDALDLESAEAMAFGDNENDIPMLSTAGEPWLMDGATPELKTLFPRTCHCVTDTIEEFLRGAGV